MWIFKIKCRTASTSFRVFPDPEFPSLGPFLFPCAERTPVGWEEGFRYVLPTRGSCKREVGWKEGADDNSCLPRSCVVVCPYTWEPSRSAEWEPGTGRRRSALLCQAGLLGAVSFLIQNTFFESAREIDVILRYLVLQKLDGMRAVLPVVTHVRDTDFWVWFMRHNVYCRHACVSGPKTLSPVTFWYEASPNFCGCVPFFPTLLPGLCSGPNCHVPLASVSLVIATHSYEWWFGGVFAIS